MAVVHVAGTNGKGGTTAYLASLLASTYNTNTTSVATFTSPFLVHPSDAWRINGRPVSAQAYENARAHVLAHTPPALAPTHFELDVAAALWHFANVAHCDLAIVEVGVGGRDDATNVFNHPPPCACAATLPPAKLLATVITRIGLDHQALLGNSIAAIAAHKAGILAQDPVPCIVGPQSHPDAVHAAVDAQAKRAGCSRVLWVSSNVTTGGGLDVGLSDPPLAPPVRVMHLPSLPTNVVGYQVANAATALGVLAAIHRLPADPNIITQALAQTRWLGRLHHLPRGHTLPIFSSSSSSSQAEVVDVLVDGAHNVDGAHQLAAYLSSRGSTAGSRCWIVGLSAGRDPADMLTALGIQPARGDRVVCVEFDPVDHMPWVRPVARHEVAQAARDTLGIPQEAVMDAAARVWDVQGAWVTGVSQIVVAGSLYLVADVYRWMERETGVSVFDMAWE